jgi:peptidoglycan/LPS O-acetylase OafA/YrhL
MKAKITELEGLRGVLAAWVVIGHLFVLAGIRGAMLPPGVRLLERGALPVDLFIILSGFVIFMVLDRGKDSYGTFITRRFFRLYPAYLCCLVAMIPLGGPAAAAIAQLPWADEPVLKWIVADAATTAAHLWQHVLVHLTMLHGVLPREVLADSPGAILGPAWSISLEWQFYLVAPAIVAAIRRDFRWLVGIGAFIVLASLAAPKFGDFFAPGKYLTYSLPAFLPLKASYFFVGACSYHVYRSCIGKVDSTLALRVLVLALVAAGSLVQSLPLSIWIGVLGAQFLHVQGYRSKVTELICAFFNARIVQWLGRISYSTYLCHLPVLYGVLLTLVAVGIPRGQWMFFATLSAVSIPAILLVSNLMFTFVETPFIKAAKGWTTATGPRADEALPPSPERDPA